MFYRAHSVSNGSGLGLYIVKDSAEKIGAKVWMESQIGRGSAAFVAIPEPG